MRSEPSFLPVEDTIWIPVKMPNIQCQPGTWTEGREQKGIQPEVTSDKNNMRQSPPFHKTPQVRDGLASGHRGSTVWCLSCPLVYYGFDKSGYSDARQLHLKLSLKAVGVYPH